MDKIPPTNFNGFAKVSYPENPSLTSSVKVDTPSSFQQDEQQQLLQLQQHQQQKRREEGEYQDDF